MRVQQICAFFVLCLISVEGKKKVIKCYVCDDCDIFNDCLLEYCPPETEVTTTATSTESTTSHSTWSSTPYTSHPTWSPTPTSSTNPSPTPNTSPPTFPSTTAQTSSTTQTTPTTQISTTEPPYHTTTEVEQTTSTGTETVFTNETEGTSDSGTSTSITGPPSTAPTSTSTSTTSQTQISTRSQLTRNLTRGPVSYHCYSIDVVENYKQKKKRGCVEVPEEESACGVLQKEYGCSSKNCRVCSTDGCNCNGALRSSLIAVIAITLCGLFSKKI